MPLIDRQGRLSPSPSRSRVKGDFVLWWHLGWLAAVTLGAGLLWACGLMTSGRPLGALFAGAAPAAIGMLLWRAQDRLSQTLLVVNWAIGAVVAGVLTGGAGGPMAAWCLAPLAAAVTLRRPQLIVLGGALSVAAAALTSAGGLLLPESALAPGVARGLGFIALAVITGGFGAALVAVQATEGLKQALTAQPQLLVALDAKGWVTGLAGHAPAGVAASKLLGRSLLDAVAPDAWAEVEAAIARALAGGAAEVGFAPAGDAAGWAILSLRRVDGRRLVGAVRDGRQQRAHEAALEQARDEADAQNAGKSRFLANMSHELRTPLNAIMGFSDIMRQRLFGPMPERYGEYSELIHESGSHLLELINDVLDMSKIEADRYELSRDEFDARDAIAAVLRLMRGQAERAGVNLRGVLSKDPLAAYADRRALKQIVLNLISNALKFTLRGGSVTVSAQRLGEVLEVVVSDTGVGIGAADLDRLGRPYEQAGGAEQRAAGTGLGLSLVRAFAELHGGDMTIESALGEGTSVTVRLPVLESVATPEPVG